MRTLGILLLKDLRRAWRSPVGWIVFIAIPLLITALVGLAFGPKSGSAALGRIRFALVDEDNTALTRCLRSALNQREASTNLEAVLLSRSEAMQQVQDDKLSGMVVIPAGFTRTYLSSTNEIRFELVKNPAQSIHPSVLEELMGALVTALDAVKRNFGPDLPDWQAVFDGEADYQKVAQLIMRAGDKVNAARKWLVPPRVSYAKGTSMTGDEAVIPPNPVDATKAERSQTPKTQDSDKTKHAAAKKASGPAFNIFGYLLPGMAAMFLLFLGENASRDIHRELQQRTLQRFRTMHHQLFPFVASKVVFCLVFLMLSSAVMLGAGGIIFGIQWRNPLAVILLTISYCLFASGVMTLLPSLLGDQRSSQVLTNVTAMLLAFAGGSAFPAQQLPAIIRDHVCPWLPNYWYIEAMRSVAFDSRSMAWIWVALKIALLGAILMVLAAAALRRGLERGTR